MLWNALFQVLKPECMKDEHVEVFPSPKYPLPPHKIHSMSVHPGAAAFLAALFAYHGINGPAIAQMIGYYRLR